MDEPQLARDLRSLLSSKPAKKTGNPVMSPDDANSFMLKLDSFVCEKIDAAMNDVKVGYFPGARNRARTLYEEMLKLLSKSRE